MTSPNKPPQSSNCDLDTTSLHVVDEDTIQTNGTAVFE